MSGYELPRSCETEVPGLPADLQGTDGEACSDHAEAHDPLIGLGSGVQFEILSRQCENATELNGESVDVEQQRLDLAEIVEGDVGAQGLVVLAAVGIQVVGGVAIADRGVEGFARQEGGPS